MAKKIVFGPDDQKQFEIAYEGFMATARPTNRNEHKLVDGILTKFEKMSAEASGTVPGYDQTDPISPKKRLLQPEGAYEIFEDGEFEYLKRVMDGIQTAPVLSRQVNRLYAIMDEAKSGDAKALAEEQS